MEQLISRVAAKAGRNRAENAKGESGRETKRKLLVVGVGSAGCAATEWVYEETPFASTLSVNTDRLSLELHKSETKLLLGEKIFRGKGAQGHADAVKRAAREQAEDLRGLLKGFDIVAILTGLGGGTGTGASAVVAQAAREAGAAVVSVAAIPMRAERSRRERAVAALRELQKESHTTILLDNEALLPIAGHLPVATALGVMDCFMAEVPRALARECELSADRDASEREARALVMAGGLGTLVYGEWAEDAHQARAQHALVEPAGGSPHSALIHIVSADGRANGAHQVLGQIALKLKAGEPPKERVRLSVAHDERIARGGNMVSVVTGIADPTAGSKEAPSVLIEPTRVLAGPSAVPAREVEARAQAPLAPPAHDLQTRSH